MNATDPSADRSAFEEYASESLKHAYEVLGISKSYWDKDIPKGRSDSADAWRKHEKIMTENRVALNELMERTFQDNPHA